MILFASLLEQNRILGDTDLGKVAEAAPPTSDAQTPPLPQPMRARRRRPPIGCPLEAVQNQEQIRLTAVHGRGWESHLTVVNGISGGRVGDVNSGGVIFLTIPKA